MINYYNLRNYYHGLSVLMRKETIYWLDYSTKSFHAKYIHDCSRFFNVNFWKQSSSSSKEISYIKQSAELINISAMAQIGKYCF